MDNSSLFVFALLFKGFRMGSSCLLNETTLKVYKIKYTLKRMLIKLESKRSISLRVYGE